MEPPDAYGLIGGVHYRSDSQNGVALGEEIAIHYLQDQARTYTEQGFK